MFDSVSFRPSSPRRVAIQPMKTRILAGPNASILRCQSIISQFSQRVNQYLWFMRIIFVTLLEPVQALIHATLLHEGLVVACFDNATPVHDEDQVEVPHQ